MSTHEHPSVPLMASGVVNIPAPWRERLRSDAETAVVTVTAPANGSKTLSKKALAAILSDVAGLHPYTARHMAEGLKNLSKSQRDEASHSKTTFTSATVLVETVDFDPESNPVVFAVSRED